MKILGAVTIALALTTGLFAQVPPDDEAAIPVSDPLVIEKCGACHSSQKNGVMDRISYSRATPEAWQDEIRRKVIKGVSLTPDQARAIVKYLSTHQGLSPEEAKPVLFLAERRVSNAEPSDDKLHTACARCHSIAIALSWRRSAQEWQRFVETHGAEHRSRFSDDVISLLAASAPLATPEWKSWRALRAKLPLEGRWLVTAHQAGHGMYFGEMRVETAPDGELTTRTTLTSARDGAQVTREGRATVFDGYAWRGRSAGATALNTKDDPAAGARETLWFAADGLRGEGRWFWGQYQEFGFDVRLQRASAEPTILGIEPAALRVGTQGESIRIIGDGLPTDARIADLNLGDGVTVRRIVSNSASELVVEVDVSAGARPGRRDVSFRASALPGALAVFGDVDYIKVVPESAVASFGDGSHERGYVPFEAIAYERGPDGRLHTADDLEIGPLTVEWSVQIFHTAEAGGADAVATVTRNGIFTPAAASPGHNFDVWAIATSANERDRNGQPLTGKSYVVVSPAVYTVNGRRYVRDLDHWKDDGPAEEKAP